jgi:DNA (cytosine-5)-methyltransferase 1
MCARVARLNGSSLQAARDALLRDGKFVLERLASYDASKACPADAKGKGKATAVVGLAGSAFATALRAEMAAAAAALARGQAAPAPGGGISIREAPAPGAAAGPTSTSVAQMSADEAMARSMIDAERAKEAAKARKLVARAAAVAAGGEAYIKIDEAEFAEYYPAPAEYSKEEEEMDELLMGELDDEVAINPDDLPRRILSDFAVYKDDGFMASLELLPMWAGVDPDVELYASGVVRDDEGDWGVGGVSVSATKGGAGGSGGSGAGGGSSAGGSGGSGSAAAAAAAAPPPVGLRVYLSQVKEWIVEFGADMLFISLRTDSAWYRLETPAAMYAPWWEPLLKAARVSVRVLTLMAEESRAARLTLDVIIKKLAEEPEGSSTHISPKIADVERYLTAHGQILLNQLRTFPAPAVKKSAVPAALRERMALRHHTAIIAAAPAKGKRGAVIRRAGATNLNPVRSQAARAKPMRATVTRLVNRVWAATVAAAEEEVLAAAEAEAEAAAAADTGAGEDEGEADEAPTRTARAAKAKAAPKPKRSAAAGGAKAAWADAGVKDADGNTVHAKLRLGTAEVALGGSVWLPEDALDEEEPQRRLALVMKLWEEADGDCWVMARVLEFGTNTVLRGAASEDELFLTPVVVTAAISDVSAGNAVRRIQRPWGFAHRAAAEAEDAAMREAAAARAEAGAPREYFWRRMYYAERGAFLDAPADALDAVAYIAASAEAELKAQTRVEGKGFAKEGVVYAPGDFLYLEPEEFKELKPLEPYVEQETPAYLKGGTHKGASQNLRAFGVGQLVSVTVAGRTPTALKVRRMVRPEELGPSYGYKARRWEIYYGTQEVDVDLDAVLGKCAVLPAGCEEGPDTFVCTHTFDHVARQLTAAPALPAPAKASKPKPSAAAADTGHANERGDPLRLKTMDIFAGCGGLSEGMRQAGAARSMWAIEYEPDAAVAFRDNHPGAHVFNANCNVILRRCMSKAGLPDAEAIASPEADEQAAAMAASEVAAVPLPGEVEFICGGPPCQGFSGMNRFTAKGSLWSKVQNEMILAYLSYADLYRPRYFLLENVRNFVAFNKGLTFRTAVRTLIEIGYQVRFGVLNAAFYGVGQSRKRAFLLAAAPGEVMPDWPLPVTCFNSPQLNFQLPGGVEFCAVPQRKSAPLRAVTVRDVIGDLPEVANGADDDDMAYEKGPESAFQRDIRAGATRLRNHVCKVLNELNERRCSLIPRGSNHDWRYLRMLVERGEVDKEVQTANMAKAAPLVPWCLPNTEKRHNGWRGLYSRLDWAGHFPTSTTDPNPMGKVGQVFHPGQDRIVSVRECARSQGFPDTFVFSGPVSSKHRQVGNAVPPPLAAAIGRELRKALEIKSDAMEQ